MIKVEVIQCKPKENRLNDKGREGREESRKSNDVCDRVVGVGPFDDRIAEFGEGPDRRT